MRPKAAGAPGGIRNLVIAGFLSVSVSARVLTLEISGTDAGDCTTPCRSLDYAIRQLSPGPREVFALSCIFRVGFRVEMLQMMLIQAN